MLSCFPAILIHFDQETEVEESIEEQYSGSGPKWLQTVYFWTRCKGEGQDGLPIISGKSCINSQLRRVGSLFRGMVATETWNLNSNVSILWISQDVPFSRIEAIVGIPMNQTVSVSGFVFMAHLNCQGSGDEYGYGDEFWEKAGLLGIHALVGVGVSRESNFSYLLETWRIAQALAGAQTGWETKSRLVL